MILDFKMAKHGTNLKLHILFIYLIKSVIVSKLIIIQINTEVEKADLTLLDPASEISGLSAFEHVFQYLFYC
jgi:hypothetical protein